MSEKTEARLNVFITIGIIWMSFTATTLTIISAKL